MSGTAMTRTSENPPRVEMDYERGVIRVRLGDGGERWRVFLGKGAVFVTLDRDRQAVAFEIVLTR